MAAPKKGAIRIDARRASGGTYGKGLASGKASIGDNLKTGRCKNGKFKKIYGGSS